MIRKKPKIETILKAIEEEGFSLSRRSLQCDGGAIEILYVQQLTDRVSLARTSSYGRSAIISGMPRRG